MVLSTPRGLLRAGEHSCYSRTSWPLSVHGSHVTWWDAACGMQHPARLWAGKPLLVPDQAGDTESKCRARKQLQTGQHWRFFAPSFIHVFYHYLLRFWERQVFLTPNPADIVSLPNTCLLKASSAPGLAFLIRTGEGWPGQFLCYFSYRGSCQLDHAAYL